MMITWRILCRPTTGNLDRPWGLSYLFLKGLAPLTLVHAGQ